MRSLSAGKLLIEYMHILVKCIRNGVGSDIKEELGKSACWPHICRLGAWGYGVFVTCDGRNVFCQSWIKESESTYLC
jgi:hypothetical protein